MTVRLRIHSNPRVQKRMVRTYGSFKMHKLIVTVIASACAFGLAAPAMAHPDDGTDEHEEVHDQLNDQHGAGHDTLDAFHAQAHQYGMDPWEHRQLHRFLDLQHA